MTCSIMCVTFNRLELTKRALDSLFRTTNYPYRLIIVDNGSTDGTKEYLNRLQPSNKFCQGIHLHFNPENMGISRGRNKALKIADQFKDPFLSTVDNDVLMPNGWMKEIIDILLLNNNLYLGVNFEGVNYAPITVNGSTFQIKQQGNLGTACMVFPRDLHNKIGYFYTDWPNKNYAHEDADFGARSRVAGYQMGYLSTPGTHIGVGKEDRGEYREMKNKAGAANLATFQKSCAMYYRKLKSVYIPYTE
jgi:GT2 family glycosyltransferase